MPPPLPSSVGLPVSTREFSLFEMVSRAWGSEFFAPDHRIYQFGGVRFFDSTDLGFTGIYSPGLSQVGSFALSATSDAINATAIDLTWTLATIYGDEIDFYNIFRSVNGGSFSLLVSISALQPGFQPNYIDSNLTPSNTYSYYVLAIADVGSTPGGGGDAPGPGRSNTITVGGATPPVLAGMVVGPNSFQVTGIGVGSTGPSFNGPGQSYYGGASSQFVGTPSGFVGGSLSPDPTQIGGVTIAAFGQMGTIPGTVSPTGNCFVLILAQAGVPQNVFTALDFTLSDATVWHLTSASALYNSPWDDTGTFPGYTTWVWPSTEPFFPPPSWPTPILVS